MKPLAALALNNSLRAEDHAILIRLSEGFENGLKLFPAKLLGCLLAKRAKDLVSVVVMMVVTVASALAVLIVVVMVLVIVVTVASALAMLIVVVMMLVIVVIVASALAVRMPRSRPSSPPR